MSLRSVRSLGINVGSASLTSLNSLISLNSLSIALIICTVENKFLHLQPVSTSYTGRRLRKRIIGEGAVMVSRRSDNVERLTF